MFLERNVVIRCATVLKQKPKGQTDAVKTPYEMLLQWQMQNNKCCIRFLDVSGKGIDDGFAQLSTLSVLLEMTLADIILLQRGKQQAGKPAASPPIRDCIAALIKIFISRQPMIGKILKRSDKLFRWQSGRIYQNQFLIDQGKTRFGELGARLDVSIVGKR